MIRVKGLGKYTLALAGLLFGLKPSFANDDTMYWLKVSAKDKFERSLIASTGASIEITKEDYVIAYGTQAEMERIKGLNHLIASAPVLSMMDFPQDDAEFHNYAEVTAELNRLVAENQDVMDIQSIGKSVEGRDIWAVRLSTHLETSKDKPAAVFMGGHHAREHLSIDTPLRILKNIVEEYKKGNPRIRGLVESREIHFIPMVNPDGAEYDIASGNYKMWRKNRRRNNDKAYGVDLNRNYGFGWGTGGSSKDPSSDTYMGPSAFSEPETQAIKNYIDTHTNITVLLSFHTFSELILYPWGGKYDPISKESDRKVFETMAKKMATWNNYTPEQSSELYVASGDTTDWAYGTHGIFAFTFELDPQDMWSGGGFYPGQGVIDGVVKKNTEPVLYMIELADNPYRVLNQNLYTSY